VNGKLVSRIRFLVGAEISLLPSNKATP